MMFEYEINGDNNGAAGLYLVIYNVMCLFLNLLVSGRSGRDRMVVGFYNYLCNQCLSPLAL